jgi:hypothetical protein
MQKDWLLPHSFRLVGWILVIPAVILGFVWIYVGAIEGSLADLLGKAFESIKPLNYFVDEFISITAIIGLLMIGFAREKVEDEMIRQVRLESLQWAIYVHYGCLLISILCFYDFAFLNVMIYNMFTPLLVFVSRYLWALKKLKRLDDMNSLSGLVSL